MRAWRNTLAACLAIPYLLSLLCVSAYAQTTDRVARYAHQMTLLADSNVLITGGIGAVGIAINNVTVHRSTDGIDGPGLDGHEALAPMLIARASHTATLLPDGRVLVVGGVDTAGNPLADGEIYDPVSNLWAAAGNLLTAVGATARFNHTATLLHTGKVLIVGGQRDAANLVTNTCALFNPVNDVFESCGGGGAMIRSRAAHSATLLQDGRVFAAGGYFDNGAATNYTVTTELYNPTLDRWTPGPALIQKRAWHTATQLGNYKVAIAGGFNTREIQRNFGILQTVEFYDPVTSSISPAAPMTARRMMHTAALGSDGTLTIMGGFGNITTSYLRDTAAWGTAVIELVASQCVPASPDCPNNVSTSTATILSTSALSISFDSVDLSVFSIGRIVDGQISFSSPTVSLPNGAVIFATVDGFGNPLTTAPLNGQIFTLDPALTDAVMPTLDAVIAGPRGQAFFAPVLKTSNEDPLVNSGSINTTAPVAGGDTESVDSAGSNITVDIDIPMAAFQYTANVIAGTARIIDLAIQRDSDGDIHGFNLDLSSGIGFYFGDDCLPGVTFDPILLYRMTCTITFNNGLEGSVESTSGTAELDLPNPIIDFGSPPFGDEDLMVSASLQMSFVLDRLTLSNIPFDFDVATITIHQAIFGDRENFEPETGDWETPREVDNFKFNHATILMPNGDLYSNGGRVCFDEATCTAFTMTPIAANSVVLAIREDTPAWEIGDALADGRSNHTATLLPEGTVLVVGGANGPFPYRSTELYDPMADQWQTVGSLQVPRSQHTTTLLPNGTVLTAGGFTSASATTATNTAELYYRDMRIWLPTSPMNNKRSFHTATTLPDGNILVFGGITDDGAFLNAAEIYFSTSRRWVQLPAADTARSQHTASLMHDGRVLFVGGINGLGVLGTSNGAGQCGAEIFDPTPPILPGSWSCVADTLSSPRHSHAAVTTHDGRVMVAGGNDGFGEVGNTAFFDPRSGLWQEIPGAKDMVIPRQDHVMMLLPNHNVLVTGGFTALGAAQDIAEIYDIAFTTWSVNGRQQTARENHAAVLLKNNRVMNIGGFDGISDQDSTELMHFIADPDTVTPAPSLRLPFIAFVDTGTFLPSSIITLVGGNFRGKTEAGGGGGASANSHHNHPRVVLRALNSGGNGFSVDLTTQILNRQTAELGYGDILDKWSKIDSSITFRVLMQDFGAGSIPYGYYNFRVSNNAQFSEARTVQLGPPKGAPTSVPIGTAVGVSSVAWVFTAAAITPDGYNIYSATSGIFIATMTALAPTGGSPNGCVAGTCTYIQKDLGPDTSALIKVAGYTISGNSSLSIATIPVNTISGSVTGLAGLALSTGDIRWSWSVNVSATDYWVYQTTSGNVIGSVVDQLGFVSNTFVTSNHSTNTAVSVQVQARTVAGPGVLSSPATTYTLAQPPIPGFPPMINVSTGSFTVQWSGGTNPPGDTDYTIQYNSDLNPGLTVVSGLAGLTYGITNTEPNELFAVSIAAVNGDGIASGFVSMGSTATFARAPINAMVINPTPSSLTVNWDDNGNPSTTTYQIVISSDSNFVIGVTTPVPFSSQFRLTTATLAGLLTGTSYFIRIAAQNQFGNVTSFVSTNGFTFGGGGPPGSLSILVPTDQLTTLSGNLGSGRQIELTIYPNTFASEVRIFISDSFTFNCGPILAEIAVTTLPPLQPLKPFLLGLSFTNPEPGISNHAKLVMARYDPLGGSCVSQPTKVDVPGLMARAEINHLSIFQLRQVAGATDLSNVRVFPNPIYTRNQGFFTFDQLPPPTWIRIYTLHGERVARFISNSAGVAIWKFENEHHRPVASGVYIAVLEHDGEKKLMKLVVIR